VTTIEPGKVLRVTSVEVQAAKLRLAVDKRRGVPSDPRVVRIANATSRRVSRRTG